MRTRLLFLPLLLSSACTHEPVAPLVYRPQEVKVPVAVTCTVDWPQPPIAYLSEVPRDANVYAFGVAALAEIEAKDAYILALEAIKVKCSAPRK